jgi:hypothetical protein
MLRDVPNVGFSVELLDAYFLPAYLGLRVNLYTLKNMIRLEIVVEKKAKKENG